MGGSPQVTCFNTRDTATLTIDQKSVGGVGTFTFSVACTNVGKTESFGPQPVTVTTTDARAARR